MKKGKHLYWGEEIKAELAHLEDISQKRHLFTTESADQPWLLINGRKMLNLASNNYLGLSGDERLKEAMIEAVNTYGAGATASRLIVGNHPLYEKAETALVNWKKQKQVLSLAAAILQI